ncbi:MAG: DUF11 domain-containing protein [Thermoanaerobaculales bacterium]|nr:DUF11 domain-containing protein [Thermoanaerobaculales bacterium]
MRIQTTSWRAWFSTQIFWMVLGVLGLAVAGMAAENRNPVSSERGDWSAGWSGWSTLNMVKLSAVEEPSVNLADGKALQALLGIDDVAQQRLAEGIAPLALAAGDFDEDGVPDLAVTCRTKAGGVLVLYRGNVDAVYPNAPEAMRRREAGTFTDAPFLSPAKVFPAPVASNLLEAGDFDADGHWDLITASIGNDALFLHAGDGHGAFRSARRFMLPGPVTALVSGEINRRDGLADMVVAVRGIDGPRLLVYQGPGGALESRPEVIALEAEATELVLGRLDGRFGIDLAVAAEKNLLILHGRDRQRLPGDTLAPVLDRLPMPFSIASLAIGDFLKEEPSRLELAVLTDHGDVHLVEHRDGWQSRNDATIDDSSCREHALSCLGEWQLGEAVWTEHDTLSEGDRRRLVSARLSSQPTDDLLVFDPSRQAFHIVVMGRSATDGIDKRGIPASGSGLRSPVSLRVESDTPRPPLAGGSTAASGLGLSVGVGASPPSATTVAVNAISPPLAILPIRLNSDALSDLVLLLDGCPEPVVVKSVPRETVVVNSTTDVSDGATASITDLVADPGPDGVISLREAITAANNTSGADAIHFGIPVDTDPGCNAVTGVCTIQPGGTGLPTITEAATIDGTTQPSFSSTPVIELDGSLVEENATGFAVNCGSSTIRGMVINRFATNSDIVAWGYGGNVIEGNFLGTDPTGTFNQGTTNSVHIYAISDNTIGGTTGAARNLISGNTNPAVALNYGASNNTVLGNFIGIDVTGLIALGNDGNDVVTLDSPDNTIGGTTAGTQNVISGSLDPTSPSVALGYAGSTGNLVQGNLIGTDVSGTIDLGSVSMAVYIRDAPNNTIGGTSPAAANLISGAEESGVAIASATGNLVQGNLIGTQIDGQTPLPNTLHGVQLYSGAGVNTIGGRSVGAGNTIAFNGASGIDLRGDAGTDNEIVGNSIYSNADLGIDFCADWNDVDLVCNDPTAVTPNDPGDGDTGPNNLQNHPIVTSVTRNGGAVVEGSLNSTAGSDFTLDFYASDECDPSSHGEGETYLGSDLVTTNAGGDVTFAVTLAATVAGGRLVTATATDSSNNTSEFSPCFEVASEADLAIAKADSHDPAAPGHTLFYTIDVTNNGPDPATGVTVTDTLPAEVTFVSSMPPCSLSAPTLTCDLGELSNGGDAQITIEVIIDDTFEGTITNTAGVDANEPDPDTGNNIVDEHTLVSSTIFADGFESGDTVEWSASVQ